MLFLREMSGFTPSENTVVDVEGIYARTCCVYTHHVVRNVASVVGCTDDRTDRKTIRSKSDFARAPSFGSNAVKTQIRPPDILP